MREREEVLTKLNQGEWDGTDYSVELAVDKLTLEVLLDIRDLLQGIDSRIDDLQSR